MEWQKAVKEGKIILELNEDKLSELLKSKGLEVYDLVVTDDTEVYFTMDGLTYYDPGVRTYPNGDPGYPAEYEEDFPIDEDDTKCIEELFGGMFKVRISLDDAVDAE